MQPPTFLQIRSLALLYDVEICDYVDKAWDESDVKDLVDYGTVPSPAHQLTIVSPR